MCGFGCVFEVYNVRLLIFVYRIFCIGINALFMFGLGTLLRSTHSFKGSVVPRKIDLLQTVIRVFALEPATRAMFREVGGFVYVMSVLMSMEGALKNKPSSVWKDGKK